MKKTGLSLLFILASIQSLAADYLEVIANPPINRLNWESPALLTRSYFKSALQQNFADAVRSVSKSTVGHVVIHFHCTDTKNEEQDFYTGMSGLEDRDNSLHQLFVEKTGLKLIFNAADDGYIETDDEVRGLIVNHAPRVDQAVLGEVIVKSPRFIRFPVTPQQCEQAIAVDKTYKAISYEQAKPNLSSVPDSEKLFFGFAIDAYQTYIDHQKDPKSPLGGVCTGFAVAILKAAGVFDTSFDPFWKRSIRASQDLIGGLNPKTKKNYQISILKLMKVKGSTWETPGVPVAAFKVYEPELIWNFIEGVQSCKEMLTTGNSATPSLCTKDLMRWTEQNRAKVNISLQTSVSFEFEERIPVYNGPRDPSPHFKSVYKERTQDIHGIEIAPGPTQPY